MSQSQCAMRHDPKLEMKTKDRADLLEAFLGAFYIDQGLEACVVFCSVCFFPRLTESIINPDWNDPKSELQQCCLTLRSMDDKEPEIPTYKVTEVMGPTNTRVYKVAVYFKNKRLLVLEEKSRGFLGRIWSPVAEQLKHGNHVNFKRPVALHFETVKVVGLVQPVHPAEPNLCKVQAEEREEATHIQDNPDGAFLAK